MPCKVTRVGSDGSFVVALDDAIDGSTQRVRPPKQLRRRKKAKRREAGDLDPRLAKMQQNMASHSQAAKRRATDDAWEKAQRREMDKMMHDMRREKIEGRNINAAIAFAQEQAHAHGSRGSGRHR